MTNTDTIPGGIAVRSITCWHLVYGNGALVDTGDCVPHFDTEQEAGDQAGRYAAERLGRPAPHQLDAPCWIATAECGYRFDEENSTLMHHESAVEACKAALDSEMYLGPCGRLHCSPDCDDCKDECADQAEASGPDHSPDAVD